MSLSLLCQIVCGNCCAAVPSTAAVLTIDVHSWQHHRHLGSTSFVVAGGGKQKMIL